MRVYEVQLTAALSGLTVEQVLRRALRLSKTQVKRAKFQPDGLLLDGVRVNSVQRVEAGQTLRVCLPEREESRVAAVPGPVEICFEDAWLAVLEKPADLPVHPGRGHYGDTLSNYVIWHYRQQGISLVPRFVSRLDKGTSGLLIRRRGGVPGPAAKAASHAGISAPLSGYLSGGAASGGGCDHTPDWQAVGCTERLPGL